MEYFSKISITQWIDYFILIIREFIENSDFQSRIIITSDFNNFKKNIIFFNNHLMITHEQQVIQWIYLDPSLLQGSKYLYKGYVIDKSLKFRLNNMTKIISKNLIQ